MPEDSPGVQAAANLLHATVAALQGMGAPRSAIDAMLLTFDSMNAALIAPDYVGPLNAAVKLQRQVLAENEKR